MRTHLLRWIVVVCFPLVLGCGLSLTGCNGPEPVAPLVTAMTQEQHSAAAFPATHGASENPSQDCAPCHGDLPSFSQFKCQSCHAHDPTETERLHALVSTYSAEPAQCTSCHPQGTLLDRAAHQSFIPIDVGARHETVACEGCHEQVLQTGYGDTASFQSFTCTACHAHEQAVTDPLHAAVADYRYDSDACFACHPDGSAMSRDQHTFFPINAGAPHAEAECSACHTLETFETFSCTDCHEHAQGTTDTAHEGVTDYHYDSDRCYACHPTGDAMHRDEHPDFPIDTGAVHQDAECAQCHTGTSYTDFTCLDCHEHAQSITDETHAGVTDYQYTSQDCYSCHPSGTALSAEEHTSFPITPETPHADAQCSQCHTTSDPTQFTCLECHEHDQAAMEPAHALVSAYQYASESCLSCHPDGQATTRAEHTDFPITETSRHASATCEQCHTGSSYSDFTCLECHEHAQSTSDSAHTGVFDYRYASSSCLSCHPDGTGAGRDEHTDFPIAAGSPHSSSGCNQCHTDSTYTQATCVECHEHAASLMDPAHATVADYRYETSACLTCHPDGQATTREEHLAFPITGESPHAEADCASCHQALPQSTEATCTSCHEHEEPTTDLEHSAVPEYLYDSQSCLSCHPDGLATTREEHSAFPIVEGTTHQDAACTQCHTSSSYADFTCLDCHEHEQTTSDTQHEGVSTYLYTSEGCLSCHPSGTAPTRQEHTAFPIVSGTAHGAESCSACHTGDTWDQFTCTDCHTHENSSTDLLHAGVSSYQYDSASCLSCHPSGTAPTREEHSDFPIGTASTHPETACSACHTTGSYSAFTCTECHTHAQSETDPAHSGVVGYSFTSSGCRSCHPDGTATSRDEHVYFPIQAATPHQDAQCSQCHTGTTYTTYSCTACHEHAQGTMDPEHTGVSGYQFTTSACMGCHPDGTATTREEHSQFPILGAVPHADATCSACHTGSSYAQYSCVACHSHEKTSTDTLHKTVVGYMYASSSCLSCHPDGSAITRAEHTQFPVSTGSSHENAACSQCHTGTSYSTYSCLECHEHAQTPMDSAHTLVSDYRYASDACRTCHPDGIAMSREEHLAFPIVSGTDHAAAACTQCHTSEDSSQFSCVSCHEHEKVTADAQHDDVPGYLFDSNGCYQCHPDGISVSREEHTFFPVSVGATHENETCEACHPTPGNHEDFTCTDCHTHEKTTTDASHSAVSGYQYASNSCLTCHPDGVAVSRDSHTYFPIDADSTHPTTACEACHTTPGQNQLFSCIDCHDHAQPITDANHSGVSGYQYASNSCYACHPEGLALSLADHTGFPIDAQSTHSQAACAECHSEGTYDTFSCVACHAHERTTTTAAHGDVLGFLYASNSCLSCHPDGLALSRDEHTGFPIDAGSTHPDPTCEECHTSDSYQSFACTDCHEHEQVSTDAFHAGVASYLYASNSCYTCHPDGLALSRENHQPYFPIKTGTHHEDASCDSCHTLDSYQSFSCIDCHEHAQTTMNTTHATVWGYAYATSACFGCHPYGEAISEAEHSTYFPITSGAHDPFACKDCHKDASSYTIYTCTGCHTGEHLCASTNADHKDVKNYQCVDSACYSCHPNGKS